MRGDQDAVPGVSSRRFACDRCRSMKLRCLREGADKDTRCDRCARADADCVVNPIFPTRNEFAGDEYGEAGARKRRRQNESLRQPSQSQLPFTNYGTPVSMLFNDLTPTENIPDANVTVSSDDNRSEQRNWGQPTKPNEPCPNAFGAPLHQWEMEELSSGPLPLHCNPDENLAPFTFPATSIDFSSDSYMASAFAQPSAGIANTTSGCPPLFSARPPNQGATNHAESGLELSLHDSISTQNVRHTLNSSDGTKSSHQLSKITCDLAGQLSRLEEESFDITLSTLLSSSNESLSSNKNPVGDLLASTRQFLDVLAALSTRSQPPQNFISDTRLLQGMADPRLGRGATSSSQSCYSSLSPSPDHCHSPVSCSTSKCSPAPKAKHDHACLLLLITSYIYLLRLYTWVFMHIKALFQKVAESDERCLSPVAGLDFNNLPLRK